MKIKKELLYLLYKNSIEMLQIIENLSTDMLDDQEYLSWKDNLNSLSIDLDRI